MPQEPGGAASRHELLHLASKIKSSRRDAAPTKASLQFAEALGLPIHTDLQQALGVGCAVLLHMIAAGEDALVARDYESSVLTTTDLRFAESQPM